MKKANVGAYIAAAGKAKEIAPNSVDALDKRIASKLAGPKYDDTPLFKEKGGKVGDIVTLPKEHDPTSILNNFPKGDYKILRVKKGTDTVPEGFYEVENKGGRKIWLAKTRFSKPTSKSGKMKKSNTYSYLKKAQIKKVEVDLRGKIFDIPGDELLSGVYVKGGKKLTPMAKKVMAKKTDAEALRNKIIKYATAFYKKEYDSKIEPGMLAEIKTSDIKKFSECGLSEEMIMVFYAGWKSIKAVKCDGEFNYGMAGGVFSYREDYVAELIKEALEFCKNKTFEIGFKYPSFNWKKAGMIKPKTEVIDSPKYDTSRIKGKQSIVKVTRFLYKGYPMTSVSSVGDIENGKRKADYGKVELLDPTINNFNSSYLAVVSRNIDALFDLSKALLGQKESYVKDFDFLVQSKTFGIQALERFDIKFRKGGYMVEGGKTYSQKQEELKENLKNISEKEKRETFKKAFGYEYDGEFNANGQKVRQHPLPLDIAYKVALYTLERREKAPMSSKAHGGRTASNLLGSKLSKSYPEFESTIPWMGGKLSLYTVFNEKTDKNWRKEANKFMDAERRRGRSSYLKEEGHLHGLYLKAHFATGGNMYNQKGKYVYVPMSTYRGDMLEIGSAYTTLDDAKDWIRKKEQKDTTIDSKSIETMLKEPKEQVYSMEQIDEKALHFSYPMAGNYAYIIIETKLEGSTYAEGGKLKNGDVVEVKPPNYGYDSTYYVVSDKAGYDEDGFLISQTSKRLSDVFEEEQLEKLYAKGGSIKKQVRLEDGKMYNEVVYRKKDLKGKPTNETYVEYELVDKKAKGGQVGDVVYFKSGRNKDKIKSGEIYRKFDNEYAVMSNFSQELVDKSDLVDAPKTKTKKFLGFFKDGGSISMAEYGKMCDC